MPPAEKIFMSAELKGVRGDKFRAYASTRSLDRDGEVILPEAFGNLDEFMKNPVLLQMHEYRKPPAGKITKIGMDSKGIPFEGQFAPTEDGKLYKQLYDGGYMNAFSVGFIPKAWIDLDEGNEQEVLALDTPNGQVEFRVSDYEDQGRVRRVFTNVELLEVSCVPVPANPDALARMQELSAKMAALVKGMEGKGDPGKAENEGESDPKDKDGEDGGDLPGIEIAREQCVQQNGEHAFWLKHPEELDGYVSFRRVESAEVIRRRGIDHILGVKEDGAAEPVCYLFEAGLWSVEQAEEVCAEREEAGVTGDFSPAPGPDSAAEEDRKDLPGSEQKAIVPYKRYPVIDRAWDAAAARKRLAVWAGGPDKENIDWSKYRLGFGTYDPENIENLGSYGYPHHDVVDGALKTNIRGVMAAVQRLNGTGRQSLSESERRRLYNHLARHYKDADREAPELRQFDDPELDPGLQEAMNLRQMLDSIKAALGEIKEKIQGHGDSEGSESDPEKDVQLLETLERLEEGLKSVLPSVQ